MVKGEGTSLAGKERHVRAWGRRDADGIHWPRSASVSISRRRRSPCFKGVPAQVKIRRNRANTAGSGTNRTGRTPIPPGRPPPGGLNDGSSADYARVRARCASESVVRRKSFTRLRFVLGEQRLWHGPACAELPSAGLGRTTRGFPFGWFQAWGYRVALRSRVRGLPPPSYQEITRLRGTYSANGGCDLAPHHENRSGIGATGGCGR